MRWWHKGVFHELTHARLASDPHYEGTICENLAVRDDRLSAVIARRRLVSAHVDVPFKFQPYYARHGILLGWLATSALLPFTF
jgi:hypothetical protein